MSRTDFYCDQNGRKTLYLFRFLVMFACVILGTGLLGSLSESSISFLRSLLDVIPPPSFSLPSYRPTIYHFAYAQNLVGVQKLSDDLPASANSHLATSGNYVYSVWSGSTQQNNVDVFYSRSADKGAHFSRPLNLDGVSPGTQQEANVAAFGNYVYIIWSDYSHGPASLYFTKSNNYGLSFSPPINLGTVYAAVGETRLAASQNYVYVIWIGSADGEHAGAILFRSSNDNGATFGDTFNISNGGIASAPQIVADNSNIYVTWYNTTIRSDGSVSDNEILFTKSSDYGAKFNNPIDLSNSPDKFSVQPRIAVSGKNVYIVWFESGNQGSIDVANIFFTKSNDAGNAFDKPVGLTNNPSLPRLGSNSLKILASSFVTGNPTSGKDIYIIWSYPTALTLGKSSSNSLDSLNRNMNQDANATETSIFFTKSADGGGTFTIPVVLSHNLGSSTSPDMAISQSISPLNTTTTTTTSAASSKDSMYRDTSVSGRDSIVISFISQINPTINSNGFFVTKSTDGGDTFSTPINVNSVSTGPTMLNELVAGQNGWFLTWTQTFAGYSAIFFVPGNF
ncbi:MAG: sialidase family protein [Nitrososphaeraceae archaeon]